MNTTLRLIDNVNKTIRYLSEDVVKLINANNGVIELGELHRQLWACGWKGLLTMPELRAHLDDLEFELEQIDEAWFVAVAL